MLNNVAHKLKTVKLIYYSHHTIGDVKPEMCVIIKKYNMFYGTMFLKPLPTSMIRTLDTF